MVIDYFDTSAILARGNIPEHCYVSHFVIGELEEIKNSSNKDESIKARARQATRALISSPYCLTSNFDLQKITDKNYVNDAWSVTVYDSDMDVIIIYNPTTSFESPNLPITGTVYVEVKANNNYSSSFAPVNISYTLNAKTFEDTQWESEYNNASGSANLIDINKTYVGALQSAKDVDWYKFTSDKDYFTLNFDL
jgi:hypothetical protein